MTHAVASDELGSALRDRFSVTMIPALIILDGKGTVLCSNGHERLRLDPQGRLFPWHTPATPCQQQVGFNLTRHTRSDGIMSQLPRPVSKPPPFLPVGPELSGPPVGPLVGYGLPAQCSLGDSTLNAPEASQPSDRMRMRLETSRTELAQRCTPRPGPTSTTETAGPTKPRSTTADGPRPRPPPKPNLSLRSVPLIFPQAVNCLAASIEMDPYQHFIPHWLTPAKAGIPKGKPTSLMQPQPQSEVHPFAAPTMHKWRHGIKVDCGPDWSWENVEEAVPCGPHPTASTLEAISLFKEDIAYQVKAGFCKVMLWEDIRKLRLCNIKILPVAVVPQVGRRGRIILDLSFPMYQKVNGIVTAVQASINDTTVLNAPSTLVREIGKVLPRLLHYMRDTPAGLHILFLN
jgi:hypothetical protein